MANYCNAPYVIHHHIMGMLSFNIPWECYPSAKAGKNDRIQFQAELYVNLVDSEGPVRNHIINLNRKIYQPYNHTLHNTHPSTGDLFKIRDFAAITTRRLVLFCL